MAWGRNLKGLYNKRTVKYDVFGERLTKMAEKKDRKKYLDYTSRRFIVVMLIMALIVYCIVVDKIEWITLLTIFAGGITSWLGISTFFKEKNHPQDKPPTLGL